MPTPLPELLATHFADEPHLVLEAIFGTADPAQVAIQLEQCVRETLEAEVAHGEFCRASSGCVAGVGLSDGRTLVVKAYQPRWERDFLAGVQRVQHSVAGRGFPCPVPLAGPVPIGKGWATFETLLPDSGTRQPAGDADLATSAAALVSLIGCARGADHRGLERHPLRQRPGLLYPVPHNPVFDFAATADGAEWIDDLARRAAAVRNGHDLPGVVAHLDWSANNVRMGAGGVTAVYDWDSLAVTPEAVAAGQAAATWRATGESGDASGPDGAEVHRFLHAFGAARGRPLSREEMEVGRAAAAWVMAYSARCEHALDRTPWRRTRGREWLRAEGAALLDGTGRRGQ